MQEFRCGHQECGSRLTATSNDELKRLMAQHLKEVHDVDRPTQTLMNYLETTCVTSVPDRAAR